MCNYMDSDEQRALLEFSIMNTRDLEKQVKSQIERATALRAIAEELITKSRELRWAVKLQTAQPHSTPGLSA